MWVAVLVGIIVLLIVLGAVGSARQRRDRKDTLDAALHALPDFAATHWLYSSDRERVLAIDEEAGRLCLLKAGEEGFTRIICGGDILAVEVKRDDISVTKTTRDGAISSGIVGGIIAGPVGAIVGSTSTSSVSVTTAKAKRVDLHITIVDVRDPVLKINLFEDEIGRDAKDALEMAQKWAARIKVLIHLANAAENRARRLEPEAEILPPLALEPPAPRPQVSLLPAASVVAELKTLADLLDGGLLTRDEFEAQKARLLSG